MKKATILSSAVKLDIVPEANTIICASLTSIDSTGAPVIETGGVRLKARLLSHLNDSIQRVSGRLPVQVLATFVDNEMLPIVVGVVQSNVNSEISEKPASKDRVVVDGQTVELNAHTEVELKCGKSSIRLTKDGKVFIKGTQIISRAAYSNKVKGATVQIN